MPRMDVWIASEQASGRAMTPVRVARDPARVLRDLAGISQGSRHRLAASPGAADVILLAFSPKAQRHVSLARHPLRLEFPDKVLVYDMHDRPAPAWPGVYVNISRRRYDRRYQEPWAYVQLPIESAPPDVDRTHCPDLLFSFVGRCSHPIRRQVLALRHPRALVETANFKIGRFWTQITDEHEEMRVRYYHNLARAKFILCPRGLGLSSFRLYEALAAGRVPVIVSDSWVPPAGPEWGSFSIRLPERELGKVVDVLLERECEYDALAWAARRTHERWFAPERRFERIVDCCERLMEREAPQRFGEGGFESDQCLSWSGVHPRVGADLGFLAWLNGRSE